MSRSSIVLRYPSAWIVPVHRDHDLVRRDTQRWLRGLGLLDTPRAMRVFDAMDVGRYGGMPFAFAHHEALVSVTRFLTLWILHDDVLEGARVEGSRGLVEAIAAAPVASPARDRYMRGWQELGQRFRATMSDRWMQRHAERFERWIASVADEAVQAESLHETGVLPGFDAYMQVRTVNIGVAPTTCWIEHALGRELEAAVQDDPELATAERLAARIVTFQNDLAGLAKDLREAWPNAVRCLAAERRLSVAGAIQPAVELHDLDVAALAKACARLVSRHGEAARWWTEALTSMIGGFAQWHAGAERYAAAEAPSGRLCVDRVA